MSNKSIIDIDVNDGKFKEFVALFDKYRTSLAKMPKQWQSVGQESGKTTTDFAKRVGILNKEVEELQKVLMIQNKIGKTSRDNNNILKETARTTGTIAKNAASVSLSLAKWGALGLFGLAAGSAFGMGSLGNSAGNARKTSQGFGVSAGQLNSANLNYSKYMDVNSTLGNIAGAQSSLTDSWVFKSMGVNPGGKNAAQLLPELIPAVIKAYRETGGTQEGYAARGGDKLMDFNTARRLASLKDEELAQTQKAYEQDAKTLEVQDELLRQWQQMSKVLETSKQNIENTFLRALAPMTPVIEKLSGAFAKAAEVFLGSPKIGKWIIDLSAGLEKGAKYLTSDKFEDDVQKFVAAISFMAGKLYSAAKFLGLVEDNSPKSNLRTWLETPGSGAIKKAPAAVNSVSGVIKPYAAPAGSTADFIAGLEATRGLPSGMLGAVVAQESRGKAGAYNARSGASGAAQIMPGNFKSLGITDPFDYNQSVSGGATLLGQYHKQFGGDQDKTLAAYNWGPGNLNKAIAKYGVNWKDHAPKETQSYIANISGKLASDGGSSASGAGRLNINVYNNTGSAIALTSSQLAQ